MTSCCFCLNIKTGALVGASAIATFAIAKTILIAIHPLPEAPQTVLVMNIVIQLLAATILSVGTYMGDRVCVLTFLCFVVSGILIQAVGLLAQYYVLLDERMMLGLVMVLVFEHVPLVIMIPSGITLYHSIKEEHIRIAEMLSTSSINRHNYMSPFPHQVPAMGF